jgi:hypothetical protein
MLGATWLYRMDRQSWWISACCASEKQTGGGTEDLHEQYRRLHYRQGISAYPASSQSTNQRTAVLPGRERPPSGTCGLPDGL